MRERELPASRRETQHAALSTPAPRIQTKLAIGRADDPAEVEADRLADQVMRLLEQGPVAEPDELVGGEISRVRRAPSAAGDRLGGTEATADAESRIRSRRGHGQPLDEATLTAFGSAFGADFSAVRVHTDDEADQLSRALEARAFTVGTDIFFRSDTRGNARQPNALLAHELTHVVQQDGAAAAGGLARAALRAKAPADLAAAQQAKAVADKAQADARKQLLGYLDDGAKSTDRRLRNSCEMVLQGKVKLYALTMTGDSAARVTARGEDPADNAAWFPTGLGGAAGDIKSAAVSYNEADLDDDTNIEFDDLVTAGWNVSGSVAVCDVAAKTKESVYETLRHELQHATDHSDDKKASAAGDDGKFKLERYKTEYRAYNYEGSDNDNYSPTKKVNAEGFTWTERQRHIFEHIRDGYTHTEEGWNDNPLIDGKSFREHVVAYVNPDDEGFNKYNSPKVEDVYQAVKACANGERDIKAPAVKEVIAKIKLLPREDAIAMSKENPDWTKLVTAKFGMIVRNQILNLIQQRAQ